MKVMRVINFIVIAIWISAQVVDASSMHNKAAKRKVHLAYPIELLTPITGPFFSGNATRDTLLCFGNRDFLQPTIQNAIKCMLHIAASNVWMIKSAINHTNTSSNKYIDNIDNTASLIHDQYDPCMGIWGSRSVSIEAHGSIEIFNALKLPVESAYHPVSIDATRWMELSTLNPGYYQSMTKEIYAEPVFLCVRSNQWSSYLLSDSNSDGVPFRINFRAGYIRMSDKYSCFKKMLIHFIFISATSSVWLLSYIIAMIAAAIAYTHGIKSFISIFLFSCSVVCLTPLMLTKKNRHLARLYISYFFTRVKAEDARLVIRHRWPVFQAIYFSSVLICFGTFISYFLYSYCGITREVRNILLRITIGLGTSWFVFFLCRSFERFLRDWLWIAVTVLLAQLLENHLNRSSKDGFFFTTLMITYLIKYAIKWIDVNYLNNYLLKQDSIRHWSTYSKLFNLVPSIVSSEDDAAIGESNIGIIGAATSTVISRSLSNIDAVQSTSTPTSTFIRSASNSHSNSNNNSHSRSNSNSNSRSNSHSNSRSNSHSNSHSKMAILDSRSKIPLHSRCNTPLWRSSNGIRNSTTDDEDWNLEHTVDATEISVSDTCTLNRNALFDMIGYDIDLSVYCSSNTASNEREGMASQYTHIIGGMYTPMHVHGPLTVDHKVSWIPLATDNRKVLNALQCGCEGLEHLTACICEPDSMYYTFFLDFRACSGSHATSVKSWLCNVDNYSIITCLLGKSITHTDDADDDADDDLGYDGSDDCRLVRYSVVVRGTIMRIKVGINTTSPTAITSLQAKAKTVTVTMHKSVVEQFNDIILESISISKAADSNKHNTQLGRLHDSGVWTVVVEGTIDCHRIGYRADKLLEMHAMFNLKHDSSFTSELVCFLQSLLLALNQDTSCANDISNFSVDLRHAEAGSSLIRVSIVSPILIPSMTSCSTSSQKLLLGESYEDLNSGSSTMSMDPYNGVGAVSAIASRIASAAVAAMYIGQLLNFAKVECGLPICSLDVTSGRYSPNPPTALIVVDQEDMDDADEADISNIMDDDESGDGDVDEDDINKSQEDEYM